MIVALNKAEGRALVDADFQIPWNKDEPPGGGTGPTEAGIAVGRVPSLGDWVSSNFPASKQGIERHPPSESQFSIRANYRKYRTPDFYGMRKLLRLNPFEVRREKCRTCRNWPRLRHKVIPFNREYESEKLEYQSKLINDLALQKVGRGNTGNTGRGCFCGRE